MDALMIGISGTRGTIGGTLTPAVVTGMAAAFAVWLKERATPTTGDFYKVLIGRDGRRSGPWVRDAAAAALAASGIEVIDLDIASTPSIELMVKHLQADGAVIITASHNPVRWNGLKMLGSDGATLPPADANAVKAIYLEGKTSYVPVEQLKPARPFTQTHNLHVQRVLSFVDTLGISAKRFKVVLDSVGSSGALAGVTLLSKLGCQIVRVDENSVGTFTHDPEPTEANLVELAAEVKRQRADIGFAQDPDADRLAIIDETGRYIGEEYSLALAAKWVLSKRPGVAVTNLSTSRMIDDIAAATNSRVIRTPVGEANVVQAMLKENAVVGGEGNGGVIDLRVVPGRDSLVGMAYTLQLMTATGRKLSELVAELPKYEIVKTKFECRREDADAAVAKIKAAFPNDRVDLQDGIRIDWLDQRAWVHARASNTEPIMRIIAEAPDRAAAEACIERVKRAME